MRDWDPEDYVLAFIGIGAGACLLALAALVISATVQMWIG